MPLIYIVDDEPNIRQLAALAMRDAAMECETFANGEELMQAINWRIPDAVILDWMMPVMDGLEVIKKLRSDKKTRTIPIIMLTAKTDEMDRVLGLEIGADDYIPKPFGVRELAARVRALLRRKAFSEEQEHDVVIAGPLMVDAKRRKVTKNDEIIELTMREFDLLYIMIQNRGQVFSRDMLLDRVWKVSYFGDTRTVDVHIRYLRQKIEDDPSNPVFIQTVRGIGYCFAETLEEET
ncbi:MAG: winged helix-turn-helix domain-containing protein [Fastidiosipilaceae bacterium]|jgi:two-component system alkaline phosphatase synthesis response regulator PhoP|nr:response regulator transcription factor [Clostridiaceae bacterium]